MSADDALLAITLAGLFGFFFGMFTQRCLQLGRGGTTHDGAMKPAGRARGCDSMSEGELEIAARTVNTQAERGPVRLQRQLSPTADMPLPWLSAAMCQELP